jgi:hypothetical protein
VGGRDALRDMCGGTREPRHGWDGLGMVCQSCSRFVHVCCGLEQAQLKGGAERNREEEKRTICSKLLDERCLLYICFCRHCVGKGGCICGIEINSIETNGGVRSKKYNFLKAP